MKKIILTLLLLSSNAAFAVLPPLWQGVSELQAILKSPDLMTYFSSADVIEEILKEDTIYTLRSQRTTCFVEVVYLPNDRLGPTPFVLHFHE